MEESVVPAASGEAIRGQVVRHPLVAFVILAYAISWVAWLLSRRIDLGVVNGFEFIGSAGPALAAMIVSGLLKPSLTGPASSGVRTTKRWTLFAAIGLLTLAIIAARRLWVTPQWSAITGQDPATVAAPTLLAFLVDIPAAAVVAFVLSGVLSPRHGVRDLLQSFDLRRRPAPLYGWAIALALPPVIAALGNLLSPAVGLPVAAPAAGAPWSWLAADLLLTALYFLIAGGGLEEPGWRGYALPVLQRRHNPLPASLILALLWGFWHLPFFLFGDLQGGLLGIVVYLLLEVVPLALLFTAVFNRTGGSLPVVFLLHTSINITPIFLPASTLGTGLWVLLALGLAIWMWRSPVKFEADRATPVIGD